LLYFTAKTIFNKDQKKNIHEVRAEFYYSIGSYEKAAVYYGKCGRQFEDITIRLLKDWKAGKNYSSESSQSVSSVVLHWWKNVDAATPLRIYVSEVLKSLGTMMKAQKTMLATWLCEIYLHQICLIEDLSDSVKKLDDLVVEFQKFLREYR
jgi:hypothetical protein